MNHFDLFMDTGSLPGDQLKSTELPNSIGALSVSPVCWASCEIKDYMNYLFNIVGDRGSFIIPKQYCFYKEEEYLPCKLSQS